MIVKEIRAKSILSASKIYDYVINPYVGCQHACSYCYARFMKRFTGHAEPWGRFVDVKINAAELLPVDLKKKEKAGEHLDKRRVRSVPASGGEIQADPEMPGNTGAPRLACFHSDAFALGAAGH